MIRVTKEKENKAAVRVQVLYLVNLLVLPGVAFYLIYRMYKEHASSTSELTRCHVSQSLVASVIVGALVVVFVVLMLTFGSSDDPYTWMWIVLYFTCVHSVFILLGVFGLVKAFASETVAFPVIHSLSRKLPGYEVIG